MDAEEHMTETPLQITQLKSNRIDQDYTEMHWEMWAQGPEAQQFLHGL